MKRPKRIVVVDEIPKSAVGKILRRHLTAGDFSLARRHRRSRDETPHEHGPSRDRGRRPAHRAGPLPRRPRPAARHAGRRGRPQPACRTPGSSGSTLTRAREPPRGRRGDRAGRGAGHAAAVPAVGQGADALLPDRDRQDPLRRRARRGGRRRRTGTSPRTPPSSSRSTTSRCRPSSRTDTALEPDAPRLHDQADSNVATDRTFTFGDVDEAFDRAAARRQPATTRSRATPPRRWSATRVVADWRDGADGPEVTAWANFHGPFSMAPVVAGALGIPTSSLRLVVPGRHRRQLRHQVGRLPLHRADGAGQQARRPAGALDRGPARAPASPARRAPTG